jgi:hypothetical protein
MPGARLNTTTIMMQKPANRCSQKLEQRKAQLSQNGKAGNLMATRKKNAASSPHRDAASNPTMTISPRLGGLNVNQACFVYQSALIGVKLAHFSGKSSSAKIAVTGQTGTQAPQSMHSTGLM